MKKRAQVFLSMFFSTCLLLGCGGGGGSNNSIPAQATTTTSTTTTTSPSAARQASYSTSVSSVATKSMHATVGGIFSITGDDNELISRKLTVPIGALAGDTVMSVGIVNSPPPLPSGLNFVGTPVSFRPSGTIFLTPATLTISFIDKELDQAGVADKSSLKLYSFDEVSKIWSEEQIISIDTINNVVIGRVNHFSFYALVGLIVAPPTDLGRPQLGDLLFTLTLFPCTTLSGWYPGHVGMYVGEKDWDGTKPEFASADVIRCKKYNVIEALWGGVRRSYYKIPNTVQSCAVETLFSDNSVYMGARQPKKFSLTFEQRLKVVEFAEQEVGSSYVKAQTFGVSFTLLDGFFVKGLGSYNCVGLMEKAYEIAGTNKDEDGIVQGIVMYDEGDLLTPAMMHARTKPATGAPPVIVLEIPILQPINWTEI